MSGGPVPEECLTRDRHKCSYKSACFVYKLKIGFWISRAVEGFDGVYGVREDVYGVNIRFLDLI